MDYPSKNAVYSLQAHVFCAPQYPVLDAFFEVVREVVRGEHYKALVLSKALSTVIAPFVDHPGMIGWRICP